MAHIILRPHPENGPGTVQLIINGVDYSAEVFRGAELVEVGDDPQFSEVGLRVTLAVSRLDLGDETDVEVTDHLPEVAERVQALRAWSA